MFENSGEPQPSISTTSQCTCSVKKFLKAWAAFIHSTNMPMHHSRLGEYSSEQNRYKFFFSWSLYSSGTRLKTNKINEWNI